MGKDWCCGVRGQQDSATTLELLLPRLGRKEKANLELEMDAYSW